MYQRNSIQPPVAPPIPQYFQAPPSPKVQQRYQPPVSGTSNRDSRSSTDRPAKQMKAPKRNVFFTNSFSIAGRICERGLKVYKNGVARFTVAYNFSKDAEKEPLYTECVMFAPNGGSLPIGLLVKGTAVVASGYRRASSWVDREGAKHYQVDFVVTELSPISLDQVK